MRRRRGGGAAAPGGAGVEVAGDLGDAIRVVIEDYRTFVGQGGRAPGEDPKAFTARHAAARAALAHLEQLIGLVGRESGREEVQEGLALLRQAKDHLRLPAEEDPADDDGGDDG